MKSLKNYGEKKLDKIDVKAVTQNLFMELLASLKKELFKIKVINAVVLFGSFARGDYSLRHSDVDLMLFLDKTEKDESLEEELRKKILSLSLSKNLNVHVLFQYQKIEGEEKSLMLTIGKEGQVLFSRCSLIISHNLLGLKEYFLIKFDTAKIKPVIKNKLQRFLYGYTIKGKHYVGVVGDEKVMSAGKGAIIVSQELLPKILLFAQKLGIKALQKGKFYHE